MFTLAEINAASGDPLTRLGIRINDASFEDIKAANAAVLAALARQEAQFNAQNVILTGLAADVKRLADANVAQAAGALSPKQKLWFDLYQVHLAARKNPAVITSATADTVLADIVRDAAAMTAEVWPQVKAQMAVMDPAGDWA